MEKSIVSYQTEGDNKGIILLICGISNSNEHKEVRKELATVKIGGGNRYYSFFYLDMDADSIQAKCHGATKEALEELESLGYNF